MAHGQNKKLPKVGQLPGSRAPCKSLLPRQATIFQRFPKNYTGRSRASHVNGSFMNNQALQSYMHDGPTAFRIELAGYISDEAAHRLDQDWRTASSAVGDRRLIIDMTYVTGVGQQGRALLVRWHQERARLVANSKASRVLAESILGEPLPDPQPKTGSRMISDGTWVPFHTFFRTSAVTLLLLATIVFPTHVHAAMLKPETVAAWDDYVQAENANLRDRVRPGGSFLWTLEDAERAAKVRGGEIVIAPAPGQNPKKIPGGLIHHWMGAVFVPNLKLDDILQVTRDYDHYQDFYRPSVVESKTLARNGTDDRFSMLLMNRAFFLKTALDADYHATNMRLDDRRFYSISRTTRVQEVEEYGQPGECRKPEGEGSGYVWELYSIARLEQREGGVYVELEAIALSRDIPAALHFVVDPIVRRVSRNSILTSLRQTEEAAGARFTSTARSNTAAASAGQLRGASAVLR
jgi:hypothetical protein